MNDTDTVVDEFFGENARAADLRQMRQALNERLQALVRDRAAEMDEGRAKALDAQIRTARRQVEALATEQVVAQFVEDSVRVTLAKSAPGDDEEDY